MYFLDITLPLPAENLALDEALLEQVEAVQGTSSADNETVRSGLVQHGVLRIWEPQQPFVVLGASSRYSLEANLAACQADNVPILRRASGGATILAGPGCLMYAVVLSYQQHPELRSLDKAHAFVMERLTAALAARVNHLSGEQGVKWEGTCDLTWQGKKFSGNALRCKRNAFLYHGTLLYHFPLSWLEKYLGTPARMPDYRAARSHEEFVTNIPLYRTQLVSAVRAAFSATEPLPPSLIPAQLTQQLAAEKYSQASWTERL